MELVPSNRGHHLGKVPAETVNGVSRVLQVSLARNAKLDSLALKEHQTCTTPVDTPPVGKQHRRPRRNRRKLAKSFTPDIVQVATMDIMVPDASGRSVECGESSVLDLCCTQAVSHGQTPALDGIGQAETDSPSHMRQPSSGGLPASPACRNANASKHEKLTKEDFMALMCLCPSHIAARFRKCSRHRASKYLHMKARSLWKKICIYHIQEVKTAKRPCYVLLERNCQIDSLAVRSVPGSIHIQSLNKFENHRQRKETVSVQVVLQRDPRLDHLALQTDEKSSQQIPVTTMPHEPILSNLTALQEARIGQVRGEPGCRRLHVKITRNSGLDALARHASDAVHDSDSSNSPWIRSWNTKSLGRVSESPVLKNLSVGIHRDLNIDQLCNSNSSVCNTFSELIHPQFSSYCKSNVELSPSKPGSSESTKSKNMTAELTGNLRLCIRRISISSPNPSGSEDGGHKPHSVGLQSSLDNKQPCQLQQTVFRSSSRKNFQKTCSVSTRRSKSVPGGESQKQQNENRKPCRVSMKKCALLTGPPKELCSTPEAYIRSRYNFRAIQPSVSRCMSVKKPLRIKSELNVSHASPSSSNAN